MSEPDAPKVQSAQPGSRCNICGRQIDITADPLSGDCGGDCWGCIGMIEAEMDADENISIDFVAKEIAWGWREADGTPRPQSHFLAAPHSYLRVRWRHSSPDDPVELWSELDARRYELRKVEIWEDGRTGHAFADVEAGGTRLGEGAIPPLDQVAADPQFEAEDISAKDFENIWDARVRGVASTPR